jgi:hypothetical protein
LRDAYDEGRIEKFQENRSAIEAMTRERYLSWPVEEIGSVLIRTLEEGAMNARSPKSTPE